MAEKTDTEVLIGGRVFTLSGYESEEYLQKIALYINNKVSEYNKVEGFKSCLLYTSYLCRRSQTMQSFAMYQNFISVVFNRNPHFFKTGYRGEAIRSLQEMRQSCCSFGKSTEHNAAVADGFIARNRYFSL